MEGLDDSSEEMCHDVSDTTCPTCYAEFLDEEDLEVHVKQMHAVEFEFTKACQLCPVTHADDVEYASHIRDVHLMDLRGCKYCAKLFTDGGRLKLHEKRHISDENRFYSCSQCNSMYKDTFSLQFHERNLHNNDKDGFLLECMQCLSSILCLNAVKLIQSTGKKVLRCTSCQFTSLSLLAYIQHLKISQCESLVCDQCSESFKTRKNLMRHFTKAKKCFGNRFVDDMVMCNDCGKSVQPKAMVFHLKSCTALRCVDCNQIFQTIDKLSEHQAKAHPIGLDLIKCKYCLKEFIGHDPLKKHIARVHKPTFHLYKYQCKECEAIFQHPQKLFAHYFTQHKELQPFHCKICDKRFRVRKGFSLHIKLDHKSVGFVEFDEQYRVYFTDKKSDKSFVPKCVIPDHELYGYEDDDMDTLEGIQLQDTDATDAETEVDDRPPKKKLAPKRDKTKKTRKRKPVEVYSSDEEPLVAVRKRALKRKLMKRSCSWKKPKYQFMCDICKINCYTFQNHQNHMNSHSKDQDIECVKCSKTFNSQRDLNRHISTEHATSKLTETLKNLLQKKKQEENVDDSIPQANIIKTGERFKIAMTKVEIHKSDVAAKITPIKSGLSVRNFLENFTPDITESKDKAVVVPRVSIKPYLSPFLRQSTIKLTKFKDEPMCEKVMLRMPERFKDQDYIKTKVTIKMVQKTYKPTTEFILPDITNDSTEGIEIDYTDVFQDHDYADDREINIPEVAQEVSLEGTEEPQEMTKIIIPKMPEGYKKIHIATLQSEAPYYKIIKVDSDNLAVEDNQTKPTTTDPKVYDIGATRLVTANPLAHLLGDSADKILEPFRNKYNKLPKKDYHGMLAKAMRKLDEAPPTKPRIRKKKKLEAP